MHHLSETVWLRFAAAVLGLLLTGPARGLTEAYVKAAYSGAAVDDADRRGALAALEKVRTLVADLGAR